MAERNVFVVIHGHFYQPPRENPWTRAIPEQESAAPHHNWNERITAECYNPNTRSRVIDEQGRIDSVVNNFTHINFNIGPTLYSWIQAHHPETYQRILEADRKSVSLHGGHGNAIAQVYNHIILPLATTRDKLTQIRWGKREFQYRYGRKPESIWLAETAVNQETVECLIQEGIRYIILSPTQAQQVRHFGDEHWHDVSHNSIDTTQPYRIFSTCRPHDACRNTRRFSKHQLRTVTFFDRRRLHFRDRLRLNYTNKYLRRPLNPAAPFKRRVFRVRKPRKRFVDVFFYDGPLSADMSFQHLLRDAGTFSRRLQESSWKSSASSVLVHVATDGEIYGHHEPFADMCLAHAVEHEFAERQLHLTNYGQYLGHHPPVMEVELKKGSEQDEGTAWSCSHGVGRWYRDCGCSIGNAPGWNQQWRTPLRRGFDVLRDLLAEMFEFFLSELLCSPWKARDNYIECLLDPSKQTIDGFLERHQKHSLSETEQTLVLRLMEAQKYCMYSYTSCAWFFDDVSGIEVIQNMRYAIRAIQLMEDLFPHFSAHHPDPQRREELSGQSLESLMLREFEHAHSNIPGGGTAKDVYFQYAKPQKYTPQRAVNQFLLERLFERVFRHASSSQKSVHLNCDKGQVYLYALRPIKWEIHGHHMSDYSHELLHGHLQRDVTEEADGIQQHSLCNGEIEVEDLTTRQHWRFLFSSFMRRSDQPVSYIKRTEKNTDWKSFSTFLTSFLAQQDPLAPGSLEEFETELHHRDFVPYGFLDLYEEDRERLFYTMVQRGVKRLELHLQAIYEESRRFLAGLTALHVGIPPELRTPIEFSLSHRLRQETEKLPLSDDTFDSPTRLSVELEELLRLSSAHHISLDKRLLQERLTETLNMYFSVIAAQLPACLPSSTASEESVMLEQISILLDEVRTLLDKANDLGILLDTTEAQNRAFEIFDDNLLPIFEIHGNVQEERAASIVDSKLIEFITRSINVLEKLNIRIDRYQALLVKLR